MKFEMPPISYVKSNIDATVNVNSSAIETADYNYAKEALTLTFANGGRYEYSRVPRFVFHGLQEAASKGKFINNYVIRSYSHKAV